MTVPTHGLRRDTGSALMDFSIELVKKAIDGDESARNRLFSRLRPMLRGYFMKRVGAKHEVDDLIQNTMVRIHRSLPDLQKPDRFKAFAMKAALFELQDLYRGRYGGKENLYDPEMLPTNVVQPDDVGMKVDLQKILDTLSPKARKILELRQLGYRYEEIAEMLKTTEAAVKMQVKRSFDKLREIMARTFIWFGFFGSYFWKGLGG